ncbi:MAG: transporter [Pseudomonadota bacterium]
MMKGPPRADNHAPVGIMGGHGHTPGEVMISYRRMEMAMDGNIMNDDDSASDAEVTAQPNRFSAVAGQPSTLRVVPRKMDMVMHMFGMMYGVNDWLTLMPMINYIQKDMDLTTYSANCATCVRGHFSTSSHGFGDFKLNAIAKLYKDEDEKLYANLGVGFPTGDTDKKGNVFTPMGMRPLVVLPYSMQLGSGSYSLIPKLTYTKRFHNVVLGAQYAGTIYLNENQDNYELGDKHEVSLWGSYSPTPAWSFSARIKATDEDDISGIDPDIVLPVHTADPDNYGGDFVDLIFGANWIGQDLLRGHRLNLEIGGPIDEDYNGIQMEKEWTITFGYMKMFK